MLDCALAVGYKIHDIEPAVYVCFFLVSQIDAMQLYPVIRYPKANWILLYSILGTLLLMMSMVGDLSSMTLA